LVEVSSDGVTRYSIGTISSKQTQDAAVNSVQYLDFGMYLEEVQYVRITDTSNPALHSNDADGYDLDAVDAVYACVTHE